MRVSVCILYVSSSSEAERERVAILVQTSRKGTHTFAAPCSTFSSVENSPRCSLQRSFNTGLVI